jgi:hypothetical protein
MSKIRHLICKIKVPHPFNNSIQEVKDKLKAIISDYWNFKRTAKESKVTFLEGKATAIAKDTCQDKVIILKQLITREKQ